MSKSDIIYYGVPKNSQRVIKTTSAKSHPVHQSGEGAARPNDLPHNLHAVALVERAGHSIFFTDGEVEVTARGLDDLAHELLEDPPSRAAELAAVENLVEHDRASRDVHVARASPLAVFLD